MTSDEPMRLRANELLIAPRHPIIDPATGNVTGWKHGKVFKGNDFLWRGKLEDAPLVAEAMNPEDAAKLKAARDGKAARLRVEKRERIKEKLRAELRGEIEAELREEMKAKLRDEMANEPGDADPPSRRIGRPPGSKNRVHAEPVAESAAAATE